MRNRDWPAIAAYQLKNFFNKDANDPAAEMASLLKLYGSDIYEQFMEDPKCAECGDPASQRCSKCKNEWYCTRECQLKRWKQHKELCNILSKIKAEETEREAEVKKMMKDKAADNIENVNHSNILGPGQTNGGKKPMIEELN